MTGAVTVAIAVLLAIGAAAALVGMLAFHRLASAIDRLHAGGFVAVAAGLPIAAAGWLSDGADARPVKLTVIVVLLIVNGAIGNHAIARALLYRGGQRK